MGKLESGFERFLWSTRYIVILAVISALVGAFLLFALATMDVGKLAWDFIQMTVFAVDYPNFHVVAVAKIITAVDEFLLATVLLIFAMGMYELFISDIDIAKDNKTSGNILMISSLDDLKDRLGKVILMILVVVFFKNVLNVTFDNPLNILYMGGGVLLISLALYFSHKKH